ncbi:ABC transporter substrate-binding protein [Luethyella okanaganae]|uniref:ABC transporter substrate-binding protein n=1 Tax=Luethyella okanaganae TaxID=69372 RepID=A0ABW1VDJ3_9MICO
MKRTTIAAIAGVALTGLLAGCSGSGGAAETAGTVTIRVQGMPAATDAAGLTQFKQMVANFEKVNPGITVEGSTNVWDPLTFSAKLAGGNIEDVIQVPLTEPQGLISRKQVTQITGQLAGWKHYDELNPQALAPLSDARGGVYGIPQTLYAQGLVYNRALFEAAGLDPDNPPATWDEVRAAAKQIADKTGKTGFLFESTENQGGWQLSMLNYAFGGEMEKEHGDGYAPAFNADPTKKALELLQKMRWVDRSMGGSQLNTQNDVIKQFAAGGVGMYLGTPGTYKLAKVNFGMQNPGDFGVTSMPQSGGEATLTGGQVFMVPASVTGAKLDAAVKWLVHAYAEPTYDPEVAAAQAEMLSKDPASAVGVPSLPFFDQAHQELIDEAIKDFVNVDLEHFASYKKGTAKLELKAEPVAAAQAVYGILDTVVQAVLTDEHADIAALLDKAEQDAAAKIKAAGK